MCKPGLFGVMVATRLGGQIWKIAGHIDFETVCVHMTVTGRDLHHNFRICFTDHNKDIISLHHHGDVLLVSRPFKERITIEIFGRRIVTVSVNVDLEYTKQI